MNGKKRKQLSLVWGNLAGAEIHLPTSLPLRKFFIINVELTCNNDTQVFSPCTINDANVECVLTLECESRRCTIISFI
jgi:hypothetical protein